MFPAAASRPWLSSRGIPSSSLPPTCASLRSPPEPQPMTPGSLSQAPAPAHGNPRIHDSVGRNTAAGRVPRDQLITRVDRFFTRSHAPVPEIDVATWQLAVDGLV